MALFFSHLAQWRGERLDDGSRYPLSIELVSSDETLAALGLYRPKHYDSIPAGKRSTGILEWDGSAVRYKLENIPTPTIAELCSYAADKRWQVEQGGMIWNGWPVATDDRSQGKINSEVLAVQIGERADGEQWKFADGVFRPLTNEQLVDMGRAARAHVSNSFVSEGALVAAIFSGGITSFEEIDAYPWAA